jgi:uncharacterized repeat protein (TIGR03803 family)
MYIKRDHLHTERLIFMMRGLVMSLLIPLLAAASGRAASLERIYDFQGGSDGSNPSGGLMKLADGSLMGTTSSGGPSNCGTVFILTPSPRIAGVWDKKTIYSFSGIDGQQPQGGLIKDMYGRVYGTTFKGGSYEGGTLFSLSPPSTTSASWSEAKLWDFGKDLDGTNPGPSLVLVGGSSIYGTTYAGGNSGLGTVFAINANMPGHSRSDEVIWSFGGSGNGKYPTSLIQDQYGTLYGVTTEGGANGFGTVFNLAAPGGKLSLRTLWSFTGQSDGSYPTSIVPNGLGSFYGTVAVGSSQTSEGAIFSLSSQRGKWLAESIVDFGGAAEGASPEAIFAEGTSLIVGVTSQGGAASCQSGHVPVPCGAAFMLVRAGASGSAWTEKVAWDFSPPPSPSEPSSVLMALSASQYIGETMYGGAGGQGTVFVIDR